jgi:hypothetical protein
MPEYTVFWSDKTGLHPGDDYAPLEIKDHPSGGYFWYQECFPTAATQREMEYIPRHWWKNEGFRSESRGVQTASLDELRKKVAALEWGQMDGNEGPHG